jgi:hypothetical protein
MEKETKNIEQLRVVKQSDSPAFSGATAGIETGKLWLAKEECKQLKEFLDAEAAATELLAKTCLRLDDAKDLARESQKKRDGLCLALEKRYDISGKKWTVDFETGEIKIGN